MPKLVVSRLWEKLGYEPHTGQQKMHAAERTHRFCVVCAGRRTGKSTAGGHRLTKEAYKTALIKDSAWFDGGRRREFWIVGPEYSDSEKEFRVLWNDLTRREFVFDKPGSYYDPIGMNMHLSLFGGKFQVHAKSAKHPETLVGEGLSGVIMAEAAKLKPIVWTKYIRPTLADFRGWGLMTSTPEGKNWFYEAWMRGQMADDPNWWSLRMPSWTNDILFPMGRYDPEILDMGKDMSEEKFKQEIGAEFTEFVGRVFKNFDEETHVKPLKLNPAWRTYAAVDYGWTNPFVWLLLQVDTWDNVYVLGEYYHSHKMVDEAAREIQSAGLAPGNLLEFFPDPAGPEHTAMLEEVLRVRATSRSTGGFLSERLDLIRRWLKADTFNPGEVVPEKDVIGPKLWIDPSCVNTIREMNDYRYPENKTEQVENKEQPMKKDDHAPEALGRFFKGFYGDYLPHNKAKQSSHTRISGRPRSSRVRGRRAA